MIRATPANSAPYRVSKAITASFVANLAVLIGAVYFLSELQPVAALIGTCLLGFTVGCLLATAPRRCAPLPVGVGAMGAAVLVSVPVVIASYGIALLGLPVLLVYAACATTGAYMVRQRERQPEF